MAKRLLQFVCLQGLSDTAKKIIQAVEIIYHFLSKQKAKESKSG